MAPISGHNVLVIGGSSGMGFSVAKLVLAEKANVTIASSSKERVDAAVARLKADSPSNQVAGTKASLLDHIVYTAGKGQSPALAETDLAVSSSIARLPLIVPIFIGKIAPRFLKSSYTSSITFTGGAIAEKPVPGYGLLSAFIAGVHSLGKSLAIDLAPLRVNVVSPGATDTELWGAYTEFLRDMSSKNSLLGKPGKPEDVAEAFVYLMKNVDATGSIVSSNGGAPLK
ncbi:hypothetical protein HYFRA_00006134 [Hymenoscyphus fraxineus]|uniref:Short chain dehydrogenase n=1 Tax=Hymenoscyphus fraxineus TaxID=746836 RepID=A0A9N9L9L1_9HELO|nr:hypothetical protein HYFRA_00006134 [Hymenoscyphus fraxineus]